MRARTTALMVALLLAAAACAGGEPAERTAEDLSTVAPRGTTPSPEAEAEGEAEGEAEPEEPSGPLRFSKKKAMVHVRKLASDIGVRAKATEGETRGARYAAKKLRSFGYEVQIQKFPVDGATSRNVVASWPDAKRYPFVVGGHIDSVPGAPGANDNASGSAVVIELARIFAATKQARFVKLVLFGAEESGRDGTHHDGSEHYVERLGDAGRSRLAGMVSVDMIADGRPLLVGNSDIADDVVAGTLFNKIDKAGIAVRYITLCDCSDHGPFEHAGIPAAFAYSGTVDYYHSPADTVDKVKPEDVLRTGRAMSFFMEHLGKQMLNRFRRAR